MRVTITPRRPKSLASTNASADSCSRRMRPNRSSSQESWNPNTPFARVLSSSSSSPPFGGARLADGRLGGAVDLRVEIRLHDAGPRARFLDACRRRPQIEVVGEGFANQRLQRRVVEDLEPWDVGERLRFRAVDESVLRRRRQWRPRVVGAHRAAGPERRRRDNDRDKRRHPHVSGSRARAAARAWAARPPVSRPASWRRRR